MIIKTTLPVMPPCIKAVAGVVTLSRSAPAGR
jgi:hypothetical protein